MVERAVPQDFNLSKALLMNQFSRRRLFRGIILALAVCAAHGVPAFAQDNAGFDNKAEARATGAERTAQSTLWVLEVNYKSLRMIAVDLTDPKTGKKTKELVWYLVVKAINRPIKFKPIDEALIPVNTFDATPLPPLFAPDFTLVTNDDGVQRIYDDEILPEAHAAIIARERMPLKNSVEVVGEVPQLTEPDAEQEDARYLVAMWRGIDPETDYFSILFSGFSNGYRAGEGPNGDPQVLRKTLVQKYWRPGDRFEEEQVEIREIGDPQWIYLADEAKLPVSAEPEQPMPAPTTASTDAGPGAK